MGEPERRGILTENGIWHFMPNSELCESAFFPRLLLFLCPILTNVSSGAVNLGETGFSTDFPFGCRRPGNAKSAGPVRAPFDRSIIRSEI